MPDKLIFRVPRAVKPKDKPPVVRDKPCGAKLYMDCPLCGGTSAAGKTRRGDIIARCWDCGATTWEV